MSVSSFEEGLIWNDDFQKLPEKLRSEIVEYIRTQRSEIDRLTKDIVCQPEVKIEKCSFYGSNTDGTPLMTFEVDGIVKRLKSFTMVGWTCYAIGHEPTSGGLARLEMARKELSDLHAKINAAGNPPHTDYWHQSIDEAEQKVRDAIEGVTKP